MRTAARAAAGIVAMLVLAACGASARSASPPTPIPATATPSPALTGLVLRTLLHECSAGIEVGTASGHDYSGDLPHSPGLPQPCQPLTLDQLIKAIKLALRDMR